MTKRKIKPEEEVEFQFKWVVPDFGSENPGLLIIVFMFKIQRLGKP